MTTTTAEHAPVREETADNARILDHAYDGIREYDNPLPGWWRLIFYVSIAFALVYFIAFHVADWVKPPSQRYDEAKLAYTSQHDEEQATVASTTEEALDHGSHDPAMVERGQGIFKTKCASCHTAEGKGLVGPNLTDLFQIHGSTRLDLFTTIRDGAPNTAMVGWGTQMAATDIVAVASFVSSLRGKNVAGKEPQGQPVKPF